MLIAALDNFFGTELTGRDLLRLSHGGHLDTRWNAMGS